ncbi:MAG TPA: chain-length determining protein [Caulobacteraceae bacterium]|jgi:capsular polysaccharide transport system permease protein
MKHQPPPSFLPASAMDGQRNPAAAKARWLARIPWTFVAIVVVPTSLAALYFLLIAAPLYVSEAQFVVHSRSESGESMLGSKLQSVGISLGSQSETNAYEVQNYMTSRDAVAALDRKDDLRKLLARPEADFITRFPRPFEDESFESLYRHYKHFVSVGLDQETNISTLRVQAFRPHDAEAMANALLAAGEQLVNRLNDRAMADAVAQAQRLVTDNELKLTHIQTELTAFRNKEQVIDPDRTSVAGVELLGKLQADLDSLRAEREGLAAVSPQSPQLPVLDHRITAYAAQLDAEQARQAGETNSLAPKVSNYEEMMLERKIASEALEAAEAGLESARLDARRQQLFIERVVNPDLPDKPIRPRRWITVFMVFVSTLLLYGIVSLVVAGLREHRQT